MLNSVPPRSSKPCSRNLPALLLAALVLWTPFADAQIARRNFVNAGFEEPDLDVACAAGGTTWRPVDADIVPGWETTHSLWSPGNACGGPTPYRAIEFWESGFLGVTSRGGLQHVELNANEPSRIYQFACLLANETVSYSYYHRARSANPETSRATLYDDTGAVLIDQGPDDAVNVADGWVLHSGTLTNDGTTGPRQMGFVSINNGSLGNFLDDVSLVLRPLVEIVPVVNITQTEDSGVPVTLTLYVNGTLDNPATFTLVLDGASTATPGDYFTLPAPLPDRGSVDSYSTVDGTITITLPAGTYDPNEPDNTNGERGVIPIPLFYLADNQVEADETIIYAPGAIITGGGNTAATDLQFNDADCDGGSSSTASYVITNDDVDLRVTKTLDTPPPYAPGTQVQYTLTVSNPNPLAATATNVVVTDTPTNITIDTVASTNCNAFPCTIPSLPAGGSEAITVTATVLSFGPFLNGASATSDQPEQNATDNSAEGIGVAAKEVPATFPWSVLLMLLGTLFAARRARRAGA